MTAVPELLELAAAAARTASADGQSHFVPPSTKRITIELDVTDAATEVGDLLDVYVDLSLDGESWSNAVHFPQVLGNGGDKRYYAVLDATTPGTSTVDATSNAAAGAVRPALTGRFIRARHTVVDAGTDNASFTFSVKALLKD